jgi:hypothetical protein
MANPKMRLSGYLTSAVSETTTSSTSGSKLSAITLFIWVLIGPLATMLSLNPCWRSLQAHPL